MRVISLTTIPPRFDKLAPTLASLLGQKEPADRILLYVPRTYRRFPDYDGSLPPVPDGVEIRRPDTDFGPASKVLHAVREFTGTNTEILFCDDDRIYYPRWAGIFWRARAEHPDDAIAPISWEASKFFDSTQANRRQPRAVERNRRYDWRWQIEDAIWQVRDLVGPKTEGPSPRLIRRAGYRDIFQGYGGVLVRPGFFDAAVFDIPPRLWAVDDIWLSGMLAKAGTGIWAPANVKGPRLAKAHDTAPLYRQVIDGADRRSADLACFDYMQRTHGLWP